MEEFVANLRGSFGILGNSDVMGYLLKGLAFTLGIALIVIVLSIIIGAVLALVRNYCTHGPARALRTVSSVYIELFRNTPLMLWMFVCFILFPAPKIPKSVYGMLGLTSAASARTLFKTVAAFTLFTSAIMAEIIRGGLNSVARGQFEAAYSQGFGTLRTMTLIILPQAFRNIIPTLLSQMITTIKDSSYLAGLVTIELMARTNFIISTADTYNGTAVDQLNRGVIHVTDVFVLYGFAFLVYFAINFTLSCVVRRLRANREV